MKAGLAVHASCVVVGEAGILIRGPSGSGKSTLARELIFEAERRGRFARLVADDRVRLAGRNGRPLASVPPAIAGKLEARGLGVLTVPYEKSAILRLVIDCLLEDPVRLPERGDRLAMVCGVVLPRMAARVAPGLSSVILLRLDDLGNRLVTEC
jgi:serine kinase of HPr protein (carbohydrate metabolism regulator)